MRAALAALLVPLGLWGCGLPVQAEIDEASRAARYALRYDHPRGPTQGLLDRALAECGEKTAAGETACVRDALAAVRLTPAALAALVPGCRVGRLCHYQQETRDRLGFVEASATDYVRHWRVDLDLRKPVPDASKVPVAVVDRDDFDAPAAGLK